MYIYKGNRDRHCEEKGDVSGRMSGCCWVRRSQLLERHNEAVAMVKGENRNAIHQPVKQ